LEDIEELSGSNMLLSYEAVCRFVINDPDPRVRTLAVRTLWDFPYLYLLPTFLELLSKDSAAEVRSAAATALGSYIYLGEIEELPEETLHEVEEELLSVANGPDMAEVRRHALESLGYSSRVEVPPMIEAAYYSGQDDWITSALFAMGRSADEVWVPLVVEMLESDNPELRWEAIRAAGELEARETVPRLVELLNEEDPDIYSAAIWSLSQIGGEGVRDLLEQMYAETEDDDELDLIEEALDNLAFTEEVEILDLLDIEDDEEDGQVMGAGDPVRGGGRAEDIGAVPHAADQRLVGRGELGPERGAEPPAETARRRGREVWGNGPLPPTQA